MPTRALGATFVGVVGALLLWRGGAELPVAMLFGAGAAMFTLWRTISGTWLAFVVVALAAAASQPLVPLARLGPVLPALASLELLGWLSIAAAAAWGSGRISRRLLGAWLASTALLVLGGALLSHAATAGTGAVLIAGGLAYKLGIVPAFSWAPLLLRHPARRVEVLGVLAFVAALAALWFVLPRLGEPEGGATVRLACLVTVPWALYHVRRQWRVDPRCARSYAAVLGAAGAALVHLWLSAA